ncbi:hypothetical protein SRABI106_04621 [Rahnella aquatilis]|nr:hypothetical protein SRABI106_04621 [Rahnella aquatilis]
MIACGVWPAERLPARQLVKVLQGGIVYLQVSFDYVAGRADLELKGHAGFTLREDAAAELAQLVNRAEEVRVDAHSLGVERVRYPAVTLLFQHAGQLPGNKLVNQAGIRRQVVSQLGEVGVIFGVIERVASGKFRLPRVLHLNLPGAVDPLLCRSHHAVPRLFQRLDKRSVGKAAPFATQAGCQKLRVVTALRQRGVAVAEGGFDQALCHRLRVGGIGHLHQL